MPQAKKTVKRPSKKTTEKSTTQRHNYTPDNAQDLSAADLSLIGRFRLKDLAVQLIGDAITPEVSSTLTNMRLPDLAKEVRRLLDERGMTAQRLSVLNIALKQFLENVDDYTVGTGRIVLEVKWPLRYVASYELAIEDKLTPLIQASDVEPLVALNKLVRAIQGRKEDRRRTGE